jgi:hypothetical protein
MMVFIISGTGMNTRANTRPSPINTESSTEMVNSKSSASAFTQGNLRWVTLTAQEKLNSMIREKRLMHLGITSKQTISLNNLNEEKKREKLN